MIHLPLIFIPRHVLTNAPRVAAIILWALMAAFAVGPFLAVCVFGGNE